MSAEQPANDLGYLFQHVAWLLAKQSEQVLQEQLGIGYSQFKILRVLQSNPHIKQRHIAAELGQTEASISRQVKLMLDQGLLRITVNPQNRREHLTQITPKGIKFTDAALETLAKHHATTFASLSDKQQERLSESLQLLHPLLTSTT